MKKKTEKKDGLVLSIILGIVGFLAMCGTMESQLYEAGYSGNVFLTSLYYSLKVLGASFLCLMIFPVIICLISYDFYKKHTKIIYIINGAVSFIMTIVTEKKCIAFGLGGLGILIYSFLLYCIINRIMNYKPNKVKKESKKMIDEVETNNTDVDKKYNDLIKLKKLLDENIITKEEFEKEKKKILNK